MYIEIDTGRSPATPRLADEDDFGSFAVVVHGDRDALPTVIEALAGIGTVDADGTHAFLHPDGVQALSPNGDADWRTRFGGMIDYARAQGWTDTEGRVRAHLEWRGTTDS